MRVAVTGRNGQVVQAMRAVGVGRGIELICLGRPQLDLTDPQSIAQAVAAAAPDVLVSAAAYTDVDGAEREPAIALQANGKAPLVLAQLADRYRIPLIHLSTDYVFDGNGGAPYGEDATTGPLGSYGRSKLAGEQAIRIMTDNHAIVRTAWVHSPFGRNFVRTMLRLAQDRPQISVVNDQFGAPTSAATIARALLDMAEQLVERPDQKLRGTFHLTNAGQCSWAALAEAVFEQSRAFGGPSAEVRGITTAEYPTAAIRPKDARLALDKIGAVYGMVPLHWREGLAHTISHIAAAEGWTNAEPESRAVA